MAASVEPPAIDAFADLAQAYEQWFESPLGRFIGDEQQRALRLLLPPPTGGRILEIGAGTGCCARALARSGYAVTAVEPSAPMLAEGVRLSAGLDIEWHAASAEDLPFAAESFDSALFFTSLEFVRDAARATSEAFRVVRNGGWVAIGLLNAMSPWAALYRHLADQGQLPWSTARFFVAAELDRLVGRTASRTEAAGYLAPAALPPYQEADAAGKRAGNGACLELSLWHKF